MERINIGKIVNVVGLKGEVRVYHFTDYKERFEEIDEIYVEDVLYTIENVRYMKDMVILKLSGIEDRTQGEAVKNKMLYLKEQDVRVLPEDTYYIRDLVGMAVVDEENQSLGTLTRVLQNSAQDLYEIELKSGKKFLLPAVGEFVLNVNPQTRTITVKILEGLVEL